MNKIKKSLAVILTLILVFSLAACQSKDTNDKTGKEPINSVVVGEGRGKGGPVKLEVTFENSEIKGIKVVENKESDYTKPVIADLTKQIIDTNSTDVDIVSGATLTSHAIINAVKDAIKKAGVTLTAKDVTKEAEKAEDISTDIVIIGAGGAGLSAAIEATNQGAKVVVVEKNAFMGGNTNYATGGMNAAGTKYQETKGIQDSPELYFKDTMKGGHDKNDPALLKVLTEKSAETIYWLEELGAKLSEIGRSGGQSVDRIHKGPEGMPIGTHLMDVFADQIEKLNIDVRLNTKAVEILAEGNKATGIKVENKDGNAYNINAKAVILASGGFGANPELVTKYKPELEGFGTTNQPGATGDALAMVEKLDVALTDIKEIQTHPTVVPKINEMITEGVRGDGAILVNRDSKRFINELETRDVVSKAILSQEGNTAFLLFDQQVVEEASAIQKYKDAGLLTEAASLKELGEKLKIDAEALEKTVNTYNEYYRNKEDKEFGRRLMNVELTKTPFYAVEIAPAIHHTMGGVRINTNTEVINNSGNVVEGLYAAGEVTGGVHGGNRIGGNAVSDITVFGRIAGKNAAEAVKGK
ncbi:flavocytochrome c [Alkaliphilus sp. MSJ-5]|uniref:Urocanate reductase n=1 Tax=Alkaliphilus flagellatus TaxID=2841507 RepID=A0ABS6G140_9FIRM|nr:flavocytochrome c [Alkaliphilus flagellatus]MBU5676212.1 flavocytochrome c [Alkaliphilus flagellatus]